MEVGFGDVGSFGVLVEGCSAGVFLGSFGGGASVPGPFGGGLRLLVDSGSGVVAGVAAGGTPVALPTGGLSVAVGCDGDVGVGGAVG